MTHFNSKDRALRSKLRTQIADLIQKKNTLQKAGVSKLELDECEGEIEVLKKELQSIEDSGHTVFVNAREMLEPKKEVSQKEKKLLWKKKHFEIRLKSLRNDLLDEKKSSEERLKINNKILNFEKDMTALNEELNAVNSFNHTRFVEAHKIQGQAEEQTQKLLHIDRKISEVEEKLSFATSNLVEESHAALKEDLHFLHLEREAIESFTHDEFLRNLEAMKAKKRSQLK